MATTKKLVKGIPKKIEADVMFKSNLQCCICQKKGDHIHHIDSQNGSGFENLALLCYAHHNEATIKGSLSRKLSPETILKFREQHYSAIEDMRRSPIKMFNRPITFL